MGASFASFYACLTIGFLEETVLFPKLNHHYTIEDTSIIKQTYKRFMDDGIIFLPSHICKNIFLTILNSMDCAIKFTLEESQETTSNGINDNDNDR